MKNFENWSPRRIGWGCNKLGLNRVPEVFDCPEGIGVEVDAGTFSGRGTIIGEIEREWFRMHLAGPRCGGNFVVSEEACCSASLVIFALGDTYRIVYLLSQSPIVHNTGPPEGSIFSAGIYRLRLSYLGGDGNDLTLADGCRSRRASRQSSRRESCGAGAGSFRYERPSRHL